MFRVEDIQAHLRDKPCRPLRIIGNKGLDYEIQHPDLVLVGQRDLMIGLPRSSNPAVYDQVARVALIPVVAFEDVTTPSPSSTNGG